MKSKLLAAAFFLTVTFSLFGAYPDYSELYVNDFYGVFSTEEYSSLREILISLKKEYDIEATIITIDSYQNFQTGDETFESFCTNLFNTWGVGDSLYNNGVMILLAVQDRKVRIELGSGYSRSFDSSMKSIIDNYMLPEYKKSDYYTGTLLGLKAVKKTLTGDASATDQFWLTFALIPVYVLLFLAGAALFLVYWIILTVLRYRPHACPECKSKMELLNEAVDDAHLNKGQVKEEFLRSVDYDVWSCPSCSKKVILRYNQLFSLYSRCHSCSFKTMRVTSHTVSAPTYTSTGIGERDYLCTHCSYSHSETYVIPKKTRSSSSSSSSSSSFSGGSSSGGGASGSW